MTQQTAAANAIKAELKRTFPTVRFSVRSKSYSDGNSIDVSWKLGPTTAEVDRIVSPAIPAIFQDAHLMRLHGALCLTHSRTI